MLDRLKALSMGAKIILLMVTVLLVSTATIFMVVIPAYRAEATEGLTDKAAAFTAVAEETKNYASSLYDGDVFRIEQLLEELDHDTANGVNFHETRFFGIVPVVMGWEVGTAAAQREGLEFHVGALDARSSSRKPEPGSWRAKLFGELEQQLAASGGTTLSRINPDTNELHYLRAVELKQSCMLCHGVPGNEYDLDGDGVDPLGYDMESWKVGDYHGAWEIVMPMDDVDAQVAGFLTASLAWSLPVILGGVLALVLFLRRSFSRPMRGLLEVLSKLREGDLTPRLPHSGRDEMAHMASSLNSALDTIEGGFRQVTAGSSSIEAGAAQINQASQVLAATSSNQAASIEEISASVHEVSSMAESNAKGAEEANAIARQTRDAADQGTVQMGRMIESVAEIQQSSVEISEIMKVIDQIAFQTNLLALNAAVEAARAGEAGAGFAVVAEEVRALALRSAEAAQSTSEKISLAVRSAETGTQVAEEVRGSLGNIVKLALETSSALDNIAVSSCEQDRAIQQVTIGVQSISEGTQGTASGCEELSASAEAALREARGLAKMVSETFVICHAQSQTPGSTNAALFEPGAALPATPTRAAEGNPGQLRVPQVDVGFEALDDMDF